MLDFRLGGEGVFYLSHCGDDRDWPRHPLAAGPPNYEVGERGVVFVGYDDRIYWFDLTTLSLDEICQLERSEDYEAVANWVQTMCWQSSFLILYELGVLRVSEAGRLMWHVVHRDHTLSYERIRDDILWMSDEYYEMIGFHLSSGQRVDPET